MKSKLFVTTAKSDFSRNPTCSQKILFHSDGRNHFGIFLIDLMVELDI